MERHNIRCDIHDILPAKSSLILLTLVLPELYTRIKEIARPKEVTKLTFEELEDINVAS